MATIVFVIIDNINNIKLSWFYSIYSKQHKASMILWYLQ
jgi:hypothetical protein